MDRSTASPSRYTARLEGGPKDGRKVAVRARSSGGPPDFILADDEGVYALAGAAGYLGFLPYRWMSWSRAAALRHAIPGDVTVRDIE